MHFNSIRTVVEQLEARVFPLVEKTNLASENADIRRERKKCRYIGGELPEFVKDVTANGDGLEVFGDGVEILVAD